MDDDDPFEWIRARCRISASLEEICRNAPYVLPNLDVGSNAGIEERMSSEDGEDEVRDMDDTIVMVSVPESSSEGRSEEEEVFRTPPERHSHSLTSSNEARIGGGEDVGEDEVDFGGEEIKVKTVDLSRDSEFDGCEFGGNDSRVCGDETAECLPRAGVVSETAIFVDSLHFGAKLTHEEEVSKDTNKCVEDGVMDVDEKTEEYVGPYTGFGGVGIGLEGKQEDTRVVKVSDNYVKDSEDSMEEEGVPSSNCGGVTRDVEAVAGNLGLSMKAEIKRIFGDTENESGSFLGDVEVSNANKLQHKGKDAVNKIGCAATSICISGSASSEYRKLPSSFCLGGRGNGGAGCGQGFGGIRTNKEEGVRASKGDNEPGPAKEDDGAGTGDADGGAGIGDADGGAGNKASEPMNEEPSEEDQTENILKVLDFLAKPQRPVYKEKVDIIGSAIKAGITFPRPSWWPEDSDDDSS